MERVKLFEIQHNSIITSVVAVRVPKGFAQSERKLHNQLFVDDVAYIVVHGKEAQTSPVGWQNETLGQAHRYIAKRWGALESGDLIDMDAELKVQALFEDPRG